MSGTSADGTDAVVVRFADPLMPQRLEVLAHHHVAFGAAFRGRVLSAGAASPAELARLHVDMGAAFAEATRGALEQAGVTAPEIAAVVTAGLTVAHLPPGPEGPGATLALGDGDVIAERSGCPVLCELRARDRAAGGHGAPLVPFADAVLLGATERPRGALNLGGIANLTVVAPAPATAEEAAPRVVAFDTGPGNMLLDAAVARGTAGRQACDEGGRLGLAGRVHDGWLAELVAADDFLRQPPPRSTGRERYGPAFLERHVGRLESLSLEDVAATLAAYTVEAVALALAEHVPDPPADLVVSGGGAYNACLMGRLAERLPDVRVTDSEAALGIPVLAKEGVAMAVIGLASLRGRPGNVPSVTGARRAVVLGKLCFPPESAAVVD